MRLEQAIGYGRGLVVGVAAGGGTAPPESPASTFDTTASPGLTTEGPSEVDECKTCTGPEPVVVAIPEAEDEAL